MPKFAWGLAFPADLEAASDHRATPLSQKELRMNVAAESAARKDKNIRN